MGGVRRKVDPLWVNDSADTDLKVQTWHLWAMMSQRNISYEDLGNELGLSRQRVVQLFRFYKVHRYEEIEDAITRITVRRALNARDLVACKDGALDMSEAVYYACGDSPSLARLRAEEERKKWTL